MSNAPVEFIHGRNREACFYGTGWDTVVTNFILRESALLSPPKPLPRVPSPGPDQSGDGGIVEDNTGIKKHGFAKTIAFEMFVKPYAMAQKALVRSFNISSNSDDHVEAIHAWNGLSDGRIMLYSAEAVASLSAAQSRAQAVSAAQLAADRNAIVVHAGAGEVSGR